MLGFVVQNLVELESSIQMNHHLSYFVQFNLLLLQFVLQFDDVLILVVQLAAQVHCKISVGRRIRIVALFVLLLIAGFFLLNGGRRNSFCCRFLRFFQEFPKFLVL